MKTGDGRRKTVLGPGSPVSLGRRLVRDTSGQYLLMGAVLVLAILAFLLAIPNGTMVTTQKVRAQTAADAGSFSGSVWLARSLNLSASMNTGIQSVYTWMTVLTVGEALAKALYSDTLDPSVQTMGQNITLALFGSSNPVTVHSNEYPASIRKLDTTAQWLSSLQGSIVTNFRVVAANMGTQAACQNLGVSYPPTQTAGGWAVVRTNDSVPPLVTSYTGDSLMYAVMNQFPAALDTIPIGDSTIGDAIGTVRVDSHSFQIKAYYSVSSEMYDVKQVLNRQYKYYVRQIYWLESSMSCFDADTAYAYFDTRTQLYYDYLNGNKWIKAHTNPHGFYWILHESRSFTYGYGRDTVAFDRHVCSHSPDSKWDYHGYRNGCGICTHSQPYVDKGDSIDSSMTIPCMDSFAGAESTTGYQGLRVRPRRLNPAREYHTAAYIWRQGASTTLYGMSPPLGGTLFPRRTVAAASPLFAVARSVPYLPTVSPSGSEYFFSPSWDVKLTPFDSVAIADITSDTAYGTHTRNSFKNLQDLRKYVLLP